MEVIAKNTTSIHTIGAYPGLHGYIGYISASRGNCSSVGIEPTARHLLARGVSSSLQHALPTTGYWRTQSMQGSNAQFIIGSREDPDSTMLTRVHY